MSTDEKDIRFKLSDYDDECTCNLRFLSGNTIDLCLSALRFAHWWKMWIGASGDDDPDWHEAERFVETAEVELMSDCSGISEGLQALADALLQGLSGGGAGGSGGGGGSCYVSSPILDCLASYTDDQIKDIAAPGTDINGTTPPAGFDTMEEYRLYKCKVAYAVVDSLINFFRGLQAYSAIINRVANTVAWLAGILAQMVTVQVSPSGTAKLAETVVKMFDLSPEAFTLCGGISDYLNTNKHEIVCALYASGAPADATLILANHIDDAIQALEWEETFGATIGGELSALMATAASQLEGNGLTNALFTLSLGFTYPEQDCSDCFTDDTAWHFDDDLEGWEFVEASVAPDYMEAVWSDSSPIDPADSSAGHVQFNYHHLDRQVPPDPQCYFQKVFEGVMPTVTEDTLLSFDVLSSIGLAWWSASVHVDTGGAGSWYAIGPWQPTGAYTNFVIDIGSHAEAIGHGIIEIQMYLQSYNGEDTMHVYVDNVVLSGTV